MNRDIKFRAWDKVRHEFLSGGQVLIGITKGVRPDSNPIYLDMISQPDAYKYRFDLQQYTGLKDKNGKEIYEGDIVKVSLLTSFGEDALINGVVYWCDCAWWIDGTKAGEDEAIGGLGYPYEYLEVIGNIHNNPKLLKEADTDA